MKRLNLLCLIVGIVGLFLLPSQAIAQPCDNNNTLVTFPYDTNRLNVGDSITVPCIFPGEYLLLEFCQGASYTMTTCGGTTLDTKITVYRDGFPPYLAANSIAFNDDACGSFQSQVNFTSFFDGFAQVVLDHIDYFVPPFPDICAHSSTTCATMILTQNTPCCPFATTDAGADTAICFGDTIQLQGSGAASYSWVPTTGLSNSFIPNPFAYPSTTTTYVLTGNNNCNQPIRDTMTITVNPLPVAEAGPDEAICFGDSVQLAASGGSIYVWDSSLTLSDTTIFNPWASPSVNTEYFVMVTDTNGCVSAGPDSMNVIVNVTVPVNAGLDLAICLGDSIQLNGSGVSGYSWSPGSSLNDSTIANPIAFPTDTTTYVLSGTDVNGCPSFDTMVVIVNNSIVADAGNDTSLCSGDSVQLNASGGTNYNWSSQNGLSDSTIANPFVFPTNNATYMITVSSGAGCFDFDTINVAVNPNYSISIFDTICFGQPYTFLGQSLDSSGIYDSTLLTINGCDSLVTLGFVVHPVFTDTTPHAICDGDTAMWLGQSLTVSGTYDSVLLTQHGCDSTVVCLLTVNPVYTDTVNATICDDSTYTFFGQVLNTSGSYDTTLFTSAGCDSSFVLNLMVNPTYSINLSDTICNGQVYSFLGLSLDSAGVYDSVLVSNLGCDSLVTLDLSVNAFFVDSSFQSICNGDTFPWLDRILTLAGVYDTTLISITGCDSTVVLTLSQDAVVTDTTLAAICDDSVYMFLGQALTTPGIYDSILSTSNNCDSQLVVILTVNPTYSITLFDTICEGQPYTFLGQTLTTSGTYDSTLSTVAGCDSLITIDFVVNPIYFDTTSQAICDGDTFQWLGQFLTTAGTYDSVLLSVDGCDSTVVLLLTVNPVYNDTINATICDDSTYNFLGQILNIGGNYDTVLTTTAGCDSTVVLILTVNPTYSITLFDTICDGQPYTFLGQSLTTSGTYDSTLSTIAGCDSSITLELLVNPVYFDTTSQAICDGDTLIWLSQILTTAGTYDTVLASVDGCDSTVVLLLTVNPVYMDTITATICDDSTFTFFGQVLNTAGTYDSTIAATSGCDSTVVLILFVNPTYSITLFDTICFGQPYTFFGQSLTSSGTYDTILNTVSGCDSLITLEFLVNPLPPVDAGNDTSVCPGANVQLQASGASTYSWSPGAGLTNTGIANPVASPGVSTLYTVVGTDTNGCVDSATIQITYLAATPADAGPDETLCEGDAVTIGGNPTGPATSNFAWSASPVTGQAYLSANNVANPVVTIPIGATGVITYVVQVQEIPCVPTYDTMTVSINPLPIVTFNGLNPDYCVDEAPAQLGGIPGGGTFIGPGIVGTTFDPAVAGAGGPYSITYTFTDPNGCTDSSTQQVTVNPLPTVSYSGLNLTYCIDDNPATITLSPSGGTLTGTGISGTSFDPSVAGVGGPYTVNYTYTDANGCTNAYQQDVTVVDLPAVTFSMPTLFCLEDPIHTLSGTPAGGTFTGPGVNFNDFDPGNAGLGGPHTITYTYIDAFGCSNSATAQTFVTDFSVNAGLDDSIQLGESTLLAATGGGASYTWDPTDFLANPDSQSTIASPFQHTTYTVHAIDSNGCAASDDVDIYVFLDKMVFIPNAFSPNGQADNNLHYVFGKGIHSINMKIFNRWGEKMWENNDINQGWDGSYHGQACMPGVYVYSLLVYFRDGQEERYEGSITLIK